MAIPLILLAVGSVVAGYVGVPHALGGSNHIESFLEPSFEAHAAAPAQVGAAGEPNALQPVAGQPETHGQPGGEGSAASESTELTLMGVSVGAALAGFLIALYFWIRNRSAADAVARQFAGVLPPAPEQVLRGRALRCGNRAADQACCRPAPCGRASTPA